jgi:hypothetical protein
MEGPSATAVQAARDASRHNRRNPPVVWIADLLPNAAAQRTSEFMEKGRCSAAALTTQSGTTTLQ